MLDTAAPWTSPWLPPGYAGSIPVTLSKVKAQVRAVILHLA
jgi:hypothetical protein